jgi:hypothetical protein
MNFQIRQRDTRTPGCIVMLSEALQRNAKPRKRHDFGHLKDGLYAAKHEARLSNISAYHSSAAAKRIRD